MGSFRLGSIFGFEIRIDFSWFILFFLILWSFSVAVFPRQFPDLDAWTYGAMGLIGTLLLFASLLAHELSHSLVARVKGIPVEGITLFIFGGMAHTRMEAETPADEFQIAGVGPLSSVIIALLFGLVWWLGPQVGLGPAVAGVAGYLALLNLILAGFNLLPGFPLDGGRLFRSIVWKLTGNLTRATRYASNGGRLLGYALIAWGLLQVFAGLVLGGLWLVFIGWFLRNAAEMSWRQHLMRDLLSGVRAREAMTELPETVGPDMSLRELVNDHFLKRRFQAYPVVEGERPVGLITLHHVKDIPRERWDSARVSEAMRPLEKAPQVGPDDSIATVLERMQSGDSDSRRALVLDGGRLVGIITPRDLAEWMDRAQQLQDLGEERPRGGEGRSRGAGAERRGEHVS